MEDKKNGREKKWARNTRHSLLPSSFSCCCRVTEALYVLKTFAVNPGMRELRCLFTIWVCKGKNKTLKITQTLRNPAVNHKMALLPLSSINKYAHKKKMSKRAISIGQSFFPLQRYQTFVPTLMDLWVHGLYVPDIKKTKSGYINKIGLKKGSQTNYATKSDVHPQHTHLKTS